MSVPIPHPHPHPHNAQSHARQPSADDVRQHIISSLFARRGDDGTPEETLISFIKVYEEDPADPTGGQKTRYLMLSVTKLGKVVIHKAKRNNNLSFSKGKTWHLEDMRVLEVIGPTDFALTMTIRRYHWTTERAKDQTHFLNSLVKVYRTYTKGETPELIGFNPSPQAAPTPPLQATNRYPTPPPIDRQGSSSSPLSRNMDLAPPNFVKQSRSGSSSSMASAQSSAYPQSEAGRSRPSLDEDRPPIPHLGRSPLGESSMRRPSTGERDRDGRMPSPRHVPSPIPHSSSPSQNLGMGPPPVQARKSSEDRLGPSNLRNVSAASEYGGPEAPSQPMRKVSSEGMRAIAENDRANQPSPSIPPARSDREHSAPSPATSSTPVLGQGSSTLRPPPLQADQNAASRNMLTPTITTTEASPLLPSDSQFSSPAASRPARRASFHPPPLDTAFSREVLLTSRTGVLPGVASLTVDDGEQNDEAVMANVEEMLEGFDWTAGTSANGIASLGEGSKKKSGADAIESRLLDELGALDSANIHAFLESDDRIAQVLGHIDEALLELDDIDLQITGYKMQLNAVSDDISYIESQNRGLQVQTSNQQALLNELRQLLQIVEVPSEDIRTLTQESPSTPRGIQILEKAAASLYKALQAGMDSANAEVAATIAHMREYQENSTQFCKRISDYLDVTFKYQSETTLAEYRKTAKKTMTLAPHQSMGEYLMTYEGLVLYVKEMDEARYQKLCSNYMSTVSQLHQSEMKDLLMNYMASLNAALGDSSNEAAFANAAGAGSNVGKTSALAKSKTVIGLGGSSNAQPKKERKGDDKSTRASELYRQALSEIVNQIVSEEDFISAFLHLTDTESTFADHMELDSYFRRQAARHASKGMSPGMMQLVRSMMDLIFGFVELELRQWVEAAMDKAPVSIVGVIAVTERLAKEAEEENTTIFFNQLFERQLARQRQLLDMFINDQIRTIEAAKLTIKKRKGVAFFIRHFPIFVEKMEAQLEAEPTDDLPIREKVNGIYERVVNTVFANLQQLAKMDRADGQAAEDKGQLNYHVIMIENMHQFVEDISQLNSPALSIFLTRAKGLYEDNLSTYVKLLLRRSFARFMDFFDGIERLMATTPANEVSLHQSYSRSALKKVLKDNGGKDMRKAIDVISKRVDKHFAADDDDPSSTGNHTSGGINGGGAGGSHNAQLVQTVWKEITAELMRETKRAQEIIGKSYADSNLGLEFGPVDIEAACKRAK
ncbi:exocyst protein [Kwoniella heveanensis CBS 569]|uniref:Exocyst protein n=1 Tax=Kwoniella heveanensis BCC8398 TaxID=1296120 RepID=A0A1B9GYP0_9TREE|nr:exocyst protein [Kwoniella heveanensis BCC8398]OCF45221.1 exocyst protein [Kwoniella heveanensis CBS 569]